MILDNILQNRRKELQERKQAIPLDTVQREALEKKAPLVLAAVLKKERIQLIAEVKRASPSRGVICRDFDPVRIARVYAGSGAAAISVLTESKYFQGDLDYLSKIDQTLGTPRPPLLRKDFIFDEYQIYESRACGADAVLLIAAILNFERLETLMRLSHALHLSCLVETHTAVEVEMAVHSGARIIGINNRDLQTFNVDLSVSERLRPLIPEDRVVVSESGIKTRADIRRLQNCGVDAVLVGEALLVEGDIESNMRALL